MQTLNLANILEKRFIGTDELRKNLTTILDQLPAEGGEVIVTQHGKPQAILLDVEYYLELQEQIADANPKLIKEINEAIEDVEAGNGVVAQKVFKDLGL